MATLGRPCEWSDADKEIVIGRCMKFTTAKLRRYQRVVLSQLRNIWDADRAGNDPVSAERSAAMLDLHVMYDCYTQAIMRREFPE